MSHILKFLDPYRLRKIGTHNNKRLYRSTKKVTHEDKETDILLYYNDETSEWRIGPNVCRYWLKYKTQGCIMNYNQ